MKGQKWDNCNSIINKYIKKIKIKIKNSFLIQFLLYVTHIILPKEESVLEINFYLSIMLPSKVQSVNLPSPN